MENGPNALVEGRGAGFGSTPITVLGGFLGAGKTTLLRYLLGQAAMGGAGGGAARWAAVVNDVAAINIDGAVVGAENAVREQLGVVGAAEVIELGNGCVCCSGSDDLGEALARLSATGRYDHIWVETSGVADPRGVATLFARKNPFGRALADYARLAALVTVVDVVAVAAELLKAESLNGHAPCGGSGTTPGTCPTPAPEPGGRAVAGSGERPLFELLLEQIECADVVVLNQCDRATAAGDEVARVEALVKGLNPRAELLRTERGQIPSEFFTGRMRFDSRETLGAARWVSELNRVALSAERSEATPTGTGYRFTGVIGTSGTSGADARGNRPGLVVRRPAATDSRRSYHEEKYGLTSCVYRARAAFDERRLRGLFAGGLAGVVRAKGFFWAATSPDEMGFVSLAGGVVRWETLSVWWAARIATGRATLEDRPASVVANWAEPHGDRRQEIVLIGVGLDVARLTAALDACLF